QEGRMFADERLRRLGRLAVALDRSGLAAPDMVAVPDLDLDDVRPVRRLAGDHEGLREAEADDGGLDQHERSLMRAAAALARVLWFPRLCADSCRAVRT